MALELSDVQRLGKDAQAQIAAKLAVGEVKRGKYGNVKDERGGIKFDSRKEANRYDELMLMLKAGRIRDLKLQPQFTLQEGFRTPEGETMRPVRYIADFSYERPTLPDSTGRVYWLPVVEDVKSTATRTPEYRTKRKLFASKYGFGITEV